MATTVFGVLLEKDTNDTWLASCPAIPEVAGMGETRTEALVSAAEAIELALASRASEGEALPRGSIPSRSEVPVEVTLPPAPTEPGVSD